MILLSFSLLFGPGIETVAGMNNTVTTPQKKGKQKAYQLLRFEQKLEAFLRRKNRANNAEFLLGMKAAYGGSTSTFRAKSRNKAAARARAGGQGALRALLRGRAPTASIPARQVQGRLAQQLLEAERAIAVPAALAVPESKR